MSKYNLVIINSSWGELDWICPYLSNMTNKTNDKYICYFNSNHLYNQKNSYEDIYKLSKRIFHKIIHPNYLLKHYSFKTIKFLSFKDIIKLFFSLILKKNYYFDFNNKLLVNYIHKQMFDIKKVYHELGFMKKYKILEILDKEIILFPHAQTIRGFSFQKISKNKKNKMSDPFLSECFKNSTILAGDNDEKDFWQNLTKVSKYKIVGYPRLRKKWKKIYHENFNINTFSKDNLLFIIGKYNYIGYEEIEKISKNIIEFANEKSLRIIIKSHPRNNNNSKLFEYIDDNYKNYEISKNSIFFDTLRSNIMISTSKSGACLDSVYNNCIVLEYFRYGNSKNRFLEFEHNGNLTSIYNYHGIVKNVYHENFTQVINKIYNDDNYKKNLIESQKSNLKKYLNQNL